MEQSEAIVVYSTSWCGDCKRARMVLDSKNINYKIIDLELHPHAEEEMLKVNGGIWRVPTIILPTGKVLVEPSVNELLAALEGRAA